METQGSYLISNSQEAVWEALNDPAVLRECIPGCETLERVDDHAFDASVVAKIGPVKAKFKTHVSLENVNAPQSYTLVGSSKAGAAGFGKGKADVTLEPEGSGTRLTYVADFKVGGKLAQIGSRLVTGATRKTADDFFGNLRGHLEPSSEPDSSPGYTHASKQTQPISSGEPTRSEPESPPRSKSRLIYVISMAVAAALLWWGFSD